MNQKGREEDVVSLIRSRARLNRGYRHTSTVLLNGRLVNFQKRQKIVKRAPPNK